MKRNLKTLFLSGNIDTLIAAIAGFVLIQLLAAYGGIGVSPDSVVYISTAANIHDHAHINDFTNQPLMDFPAFYPIFLTGVMFLTGHGIVAIGPLLNGFLFAALIGLCGWMMNRWPYPSRWYKWTILACIVGSPCLLEVYSMIWSETLFLLFSMIFLIACHRYFNRHTLGTLLFMGLIAGLTCVTRYAGVSVVGLGGFLMLLDGRLKWSWKKIGHMAVYGAVSFGILGINLYRNYLQTETLTGYREKGLTPFLANLHNYGAVLCDWLPFFDEHYGAATWVGAFFLLFITGIFVYRLVRRAGFFSYDTLAVSFFVFYSYFILATATISRFQTLDSRLLSPLFLPWLWGSSCWIPRVLGRNGKAPVGQTQPIAPAPAPVGQTQPMTPAPLMKKVIAGLCLIAGFCFLLGEWQDWKETWSGVHYAGIPGFSEDLWKKSETMNYVRVHRKELEAAGPVYSDSFEGLWYLSNGMESELLPHKDNNEDIQYMLKEDHFSMIWFDDAINTDLIDVDFIRKHKVQVDQINFSDGAIYFFRSKADSTAH